MSRIRKIEIHNFRCIKHCEWWPAAGVNCLVGPGDSGKSSLLDAIGLCLAARRNIPIKDTDFHSLDVDHPIEIFVTLGSLDGPLKNIDTYGLYLQGFDSESGDIVEEPESGKETVLTVCLRVESDLEPQWSLMSQRAQAQNQSRALSWADRLRIAPNRLGVYTDYNLGWSKGSILNKVSEERADATGALAEAAREARLSFGDKAKEQIGGTLKIVKDTATTLGIPVGEEVKALLDASSVSFGGGTIALHDELGVPLRSLGLGSTRLLVAGLQRRAAEQATIVLVDEIEHGLEPHRITRLLDELGAKEQDPPLQVFMTTHSPVVVRELSANQLSVLRRDADQHRIGNADATDVIQGTIRKYPEALLAEKILVCEGASEVGFIRGLDQHRVAQIQPSISTHGITLVDGGGDEVFKRATALQDLGYCVAVLRDSDVVPTPDLQTSFKAAGGQVFAWREDRAIEDELFLSLSDTAIGQLLDMAVSFKEEALVNEHVKSASNNAKGLEAIRIDFLVGEDSQENRRLLSKASRTKRGWFKTVTAMQEAARDIIAPDLPNADTGFCAIVTSVFDWTSDDGK